MDHITRPTHRSTGQRVLRGLGLGAGLGAAGGAGAAFAVTAYLSLWAFSEGVVGMLGVFGAVAPIAAIFGAVLGFFMGMPVGTVLAAVEGERFAPWVSAAISAVLPLAAVAEATPGVLLASVGFGAIGWMVGMIFATTLDPPPPGWDPEFHAAETFPVQH